MKLFIIALVIAIAFAACLLGTTEAALAYGPAAKDARFPGKCYDKTTDKGYEPGEKWQLPNCVEGRCYKREDALYFQSASCGVVLTDPGVELVSDHSKPYPDCCPQPAR